MNSDQNNQLQHSLKHLAIIMDGNARWAKENGKTKAMGHKAGAEAAGKITKLACDFGISYLTLYAFSSENWQRPKTEVSILMDLLLHYVKNEIKSIHDKGIRLVIIGNLAKLTPDLQQEISKAMELTRNNSNMTLAIAISYGSREEIISACQKMIDNNIKKVDEDTFARCLYAPDMPDVDLLIRTSGACRISNFLLWQSAYAELLFINKYWPEFSEEDLQSAINDFSIRKRNFGKRRGSNE